MKRRTQEILGDILVAQLTAMRPQIEAEYIRLLSTGMSRQDAMKALADGIMSNITMVSVH